MIIELLYISYVKQLILLKMKQLKKMSLISLTQSEMTKREQGFIIGGYTTCACKINCPCLYAGDQEGPDDSYYGGSSRVDNKAANGGSDSLDYNIMSL